MKSKKADILKNEERLKENPFLVPDGYFTGFSSRIQSRIATGKATPVKARNLRYSFRSQIALAASVIGFAILSFATVKLILSKPTQNAEYIDIALLEEMDVIFDETMLIDVYPLEDTEYNEEDAWVNEAVEYLASNDIEIDLFLE